MKRIVFLLTLITISLATHSLFAQAPLATVSRDNGQYLGKTSSAGHLLWEETVILEPKGPCKVEKLYIYFDGTTAATDTIYLSGDASEGFTPPTQYVWKYNLLTEPIIIQYDGKKGWDTIDISNRNVRSDGYDRIVVTHQLKSKGPYFAYAKGGIGKPPYGSWLYEPFKPDPNFYNIIGKLYLPNGNFMVRLGVAYDHPEGDSSAPPPPATLKDVTLAAGISVNGDTLLSDRVSVVDFNGDGWDDLAIGSRFYQNAKASSEPRFIDVTDSVKIVASATTWGDFNNDGKIDCYAVNGGAGDKIYKNNGDGSFTDVTLGSGLSNPYPTVMPIWFDANRDGNLDLYIANGRTESNGQEEYFPDQLWINNGNGTFTNATETSAIADAESTPVDCWGASACDFNGDGWTDIFVANYRLVPDFLFKNNHDGTFKEVGEETGVRGVETDDPNYFGHGIGCDWGDFNNDGYVDLAVGNLGHPDSRGAVSNPSLIFKNNGPSKGYTFTDVHYGMGLKFKEMNANIFWADLDLDGWQDLFHCQYSYYHAGDEVGGPGGIPEPFRYSRVYLNQGSANNFKLHDVTWGLGALVHGAWTAARGDFNNDGKMDIVVATGKLVNGKKQGVKLFQNLIPAKGHWLEIRLVGDPAYHLSMDAYGSRVIAYAKGQTFYRDLQGGGTGATGTQHSNILHFGVGDATVMDSVVILYPNGGRRVMQNVAADQSYTITYNEALTSVKNRTDVESTLRINSISTEEGVLRFVLSGVAEGMSVECKVIDIRGIAREQVSLVGTGNLLEGTMPDNLGSGTYFLKVTIGEQFTAQKFIMTK